MCCVLRVTVFDIRCIKHPTYFIHHHLRIIIGWATGVQPTESNIEETPNITQGEGILLQPHELHVSIILLICKLPRPVARKYNVHVGHFNCCVV